VAPAGATRSVIGAARAAVNRSAGGGARAQNRRARAILNDIEAASRRGRGGPRLTNAQVVDFRRRLRAISVASR
jgi:hypothetical protein